MGDWPAIEVVGRQASLLADATDLLAAAGEPERAVASARYLRTDQPMFGTGMPTVRDAVRALARTGYPVADHDTYVADVLALWSGRERELQYLAIKWARRWRAHIVPASLPTYERMVVEGAWWDLVDDVASNLVGGVLLHHRRETTPLVRSWIDDDDLWRRRTVLVCQLRHREETDEQLLFDACLAMADEREFFLRKAIGWGLRQHARTAPDRVTAFLLDHRDRWSGLTWREATKHLDIGDR